VVFVPDAAVVQAVLFRVDQKFDLTLGERDEFGVAVVGHAFEEVDADDGENQHDQHNYYEETSNSWCRDVKCLDRYS